jgi:hypothetical protein
MEVIIVIVILALLIGHMVYVSFFSFSEVFNKGTFTPEYFQQLRRDDKQSEFASEKEDELANKLLDEVFASYPYLNKGKNQFRQPKSKKQLKEAIACVNQVILNVKPTNPETIEYLNKLTKINYINSSRIFTGSIFVVILGALVGILIGTQMIFGGVAWVILTIAYFLSSSCPVCLATKRSNQIFGGVEKNTVEEIECVISDSKVIHPYKDVLTNEYSAKKSSNAMASFFLSLFKTMIMPYIVIANYLRNYILS